MSDEAHCSWFSFILCFRVQKGKEEAALDSLQDGYRELVKELLLLTGHVRLRETHSGAGSSLEVAYDPEGLCPSIENWDLRTLLPPFDGVISSQDAVKEFCRSLVDPPTLDRYSTTTALLLQGAIVTGGILLCICVQHCICDAVGADILVHHLAVHCRKDNNALANVELWNDRSLLKFDGLEALATEYRNDRESYAERTKGLSDNRREATKPYQVPISRTFRCLESDIDVIKREVSRKLQPQNKFVSTLDTLTAFVWHRICLAQAPDLAPSTVCTLDYHVDFRNRKDASLPVNYIGNATASFKLRQSMSDLIKFSDRAVGVELLIENSQKTSYQS